MGQNLLILALTALIPLVVGSIWYSPLLFAKPWMESTGITEDKRKNSNMALNMGLLFIFSFFIAFELQFLVIHQWGLFGMLMTPNGKIAMGNPDSDISKALSLLGPQMHNFRTYRHGGLIGFIASITFALPLIASGAMFEQRSFKYILITLGYWTINLVLMGAVVCHWAMGPETMKM
jgi:hypothetical protein